MDLDSALKDKPAEGASATEILRADHAEARRFFADYRNGGASQQQRKVALHSLCLALELHDRIERDVFYPAVRALDGALTDAFLHAHDEVMAIVRKLRDRESFDADCDAAVSRVEALVNGHVREEENALFPRVERQGRAKLVVIGEAIVKRK